MSEILLSAQGVSKGFASPEGKIHVLEEIDLEVKKGEVLAIVGRSGSGKTTLLHILGLLEEPDQGAVTFKEIPFWRRGKEEGVEIKEDKKEKMRNCEIGFVFQFYHLISELTALENATLPLWIGKENEADARAAAGVLLDELEMGPRKNMFPSTLSGGEQQRVAVARALIHSPSLILADEPTGDLDSVSAEQVGKALLKAVRKRGGSLIWVTHSEIWAKRADRILRLENGHLRKA